jgi:hypothetical protein
MVVSASKLGRIGMVIGAAGCAASSYRLPLTPAQVAEAREPQALVLYLSQRDANPAVCDATAAGPHVVADDRAGRALLDALQTGAIAPPIWQVCVDRILASARSDHQTALLDAMLRTYRALVTSPSLERDPAIQARLVALSTVYSERSPDIRAPATAVELGGELRKAARTLGPIGRHSAEAMIAQLDVERAVWGARAIDPAYLDELTTPDNEPFLTFLAARLSDANLRAEARRRVIRLHIAVSPFSEVHEDASHIEAMMMELGKNPISPKLQLPTAAQLDASELSIDRVIITQDVRAQVASLAGAPPAGVGGATVPVIALRGALTFNVTGVSQPITFCGAASELDPSPCLLPGDLTVDNPLVHLDAVGTLQLPEALPAGQVVELARASRQLAVPLAVGHETITTLAWPLVFATPEPAVFTGDNFGVVGPPLNVIVEQRGDLLIYAIDHGHGIAWAVAPVADAAKFAIVSRGGDGRPGKDGKPGKDGVDGVTGMTDTPGGQGGDGAAGEDGDPGSPGGPGGPIRVQLTCEAAACDGVIADLRTAIRSVGGDGGPGGRGGDGGRGGMGGATGLISASENALSLMGGASGADGVPGKEGKEGKAGGTGTRRFQIERVGAPARPDPAPPPAPAPAVIGPSPAPAIN